jgi:hypothetical protein
MGFFNNNNNNGADISLESIKPIMLDEDDEFFYHKEDF